MPASSSKGYTRILRCGRLLGRPEKLFQAKHATCASPGYDVGCFKKPRAVALGIKRRPVGKCVPDATAVLPGSSCAIAGCIPEYAYALGIDSRGCLGFDTGRRPKNSAGSRRRDSGRIGTNPESCRSFPIGDCRLVRLVHRRLRKLLQRRIRKAKPKLFGEPCASPLEANRFIFGTSRRNGVWRVPILGRLLKASAHVTTGI